MKETAHQSEEASSAAKPRLNVSRILFWGMAVTVVLALVLVGVLPWRRGSTDHPKDPYATIPFRPRVTYDEISVAVTNTEQQPYLDTSLNIYIDGTLYSVYIGTIAPGETVTRSLKSLTNKRGERFTPHTARTSELEVRARFGGYDVHKDFPPPP